MAYKHRPAIALKPPPFLWNQLVSQRERWIIYPLLFFCFSMCIKLYWYPPEFHNIKAKSLTCRDLFVKDEYDRLLLTASGVNGDGVLQLHAAPAAGAPGSSPLVAVRLGTTQNRRGFVAVFSEIGQPLVELASDDRGGNVVLFDAVGRREVVMHLPALDPNNPRSAPVRPPVPPPESPIAAPPPAVGTNAT